MTATKITMSGETDPVEGEIVRIGRVIHANSRCDAALPLLGGGWRVCGRPATQAYTYACVHEHVHTRVNCGDHHPVAGDVGCRECWDEGHECAMTFWPVRL